MASDIRRRDTPEAREYWDHVKRTADHIHRLSLLSDRRPCWTLVVVLRSVREWGFWHRGMFQHWRNYVAPGNTMADERKACP